MTPKKPGGRGGKPTEKACKHCGKIYKAPESECWENPANAEKKRAARVLKMALQMGDGAGNNENEEDVDSDVNDSDLYMSVFPQFHPLPATCTVLSACDARAWAAIATWELAMCRFCPRIRRRPCLGRVEGQGPLQAPSVL